MRRESHGVNLQQQDKKMNITKKDIERSIDMLNKDLEKPRVAWFRDTEGALKGSVGAFHLSQAYGGYSLYQMVSESGDVIDVFGCGHIRRRQLYGLVGAMLQGVSDKASVNL